MMKNEFRIVGDDVEITLKRRTGERIITVIEKSDMHLMWLYPNTWHAHWSPSTQSYYAKGTSQGFQRGRGESLSIPLHVYLLDARPGEIVDHKDRNTLNNRRRNLRSVTHSVNAFNHSPKSERGRSGLRGVQWDSQTRRWRAEVCVQRYRIYLGSFVLKEEAFDVAQAACREIEATIDAGRLVNVAEVRRKHGRLREWCLQAESLRGDSTRSKSFDADGGSRQTVRTVCSRGHLLIPENRRPNGQRGDRCLPCRRITDAAKATHGDPGEPDEEEAE